MTWFKVDDALHSHPKALAAGDLALGLWVRLGSWSGAHLTEGVIPAGVAKKMGRSRQYRALNDAGMLHESDAEVLACPSCAETGARLLEPGFMLHDFLIYNPRKAKVEAEKADTRRRVAAHREAKKQAARNGDGNGVTNGVGTGVPTRPDPTRTALGLVGGEEDDVDGTTHQGPEQVYVDDDHEDPEPIRRTLRAVVEGWGDTVPEGLVS